MTPLTLEAVAQRLESLERKVAELTRTATKAADSSRDQFYAEAARYPDTEAGFAAQKELFRQWRTDTSFEPYWPLLDHLLARDFADMQKSRERADAAQRIRESGTYDFGAVREQDECDLRHVNDHLP